MTSAVDTPVPQVMAAHVRGLLAVLKRLARWAKGDELAREMASNGRNWERKVRRIASVARPVVVSYPGSPGYCHLDAVTDEELAHCVAAHRAVSKDHAFSADLYQAALDKRRAERARLAKPVQAELGLDA